MMRPISLLCMLLAIGSGLYLYRVKYTAQMLDREIHATLRAADETRARAGLLRADYALLNDPIRLQELVDQHLQLKSTQPGQFTTLAELERRLPPVGLAPPEPPPEPEIPAAVIRPEPKVPVAGPRAPEPRIVERPAPATAPAIAPGGVPVAAPTVTAAVPRPAPAPPAAAAPPARATTMATPPATPSVAAAPRAPTPLALPGSTAQATPQAARPAPPPAPAPAQAQAQPPASAPSPITPVGLRSTPMPAATPSAGAVSVPRSPNPAPRAATAAPPPPAEAAPVVVRSSLGMARRLPSTMNSATGPGGGGEN